MVRLIPVRAHFVGRQNGQPTLWVNPEHIVIAQPKYTGDAAALDLNVELKLAGMPLFDIFVGRYDSRSDAETAWEKLLADFQT